MFEEERTYSYVFGVSRQIGPVSEGILFRSDKHIRKGKGRAYVDQGEDCAVCIICGIVCRILDVLLPTLGPLRQKKTGLSAYPVSGLREFL